MFVLLILFFFQVSCEKVMTTSLKLFPNIKVEQLKKDCGDNYFPFFHSLKCTNVCSLKGEVNVEVLSELEKMLCADKSGCEKINQDVIQIWKSKLQFGEMFFYVENKTMSLWVTKEKLNEDFKNICVLNKEEFHDYVMSLIIIFFCIVYIFSILILLFLMNLFHRLQLKKKE